MHKVIGVRFKKVGKIYWFGTGKFDVQLNSHVIVETVRGVEIGKCVIPLKEVPDGEIMPPLKHIMRVADERDMKHYEKNKVKCQEIFDTCKSKIEDHELDMKLIDVEYTFDNNKIIFYFTADGRIDFRELVKDLAAIFKTRIELRQIGVRDETKMMGAIGICGRELCCKGFLGDFHPVSIKMAKEQGMPLNPIKISGMCGRLMCCLNYEQHAYEDVLKRAPRVGALVDTPDGKGNIVSVNLLKEKVKVILTLDSETEQKEYKLDEIKVIKNSVNRDGKSKRPSHLEDVDIDQLKMLED